MENKAMALHLWQAFGPWGPRRFTAYNYMNENGYLPRDWDWAASTLSICYPTLPYLTPLSSGGICDLLSSNLMPLYRSVPDTSGIPEVCVDELGNVSTIEAIPEMHKSPLNEPRYPKPSEANPSAPKQPPPRYPYREWGGDAGAESSDYTSDWHQDWWSRGNKWKK